jgi:phosphate-selective porin
MIDLNDQLATANGVAGGKQTVHTAGLNWVSSVRGGRLAEILCSR